MPSDILAKLPRELRDNIIYLALPDTIYVTLDDAEHYRHSPTPLLQVCRYLRQESLEILAKKVVICAYTSETLSALLSSTDKSGQFFPTLPRHLGIRISEDDSGSDLPLERIIAPLNEPVGQFPQGVRSLTVDISPLCSTLPNQECGTVSFDEKSQMKVHITGWPTELNIAPCSLSWIDDMRLPRVSD